MKTPTTRNGIPLISMYSPIAGFPSSNGHGRRQPGLEVVSRQSNLLVESTVGGVEIGALMRQLGTGLLVTELMGQGVNGVTGDYSRGASGFWIENGVQAYPVHEITIAGNLKQMYRNIAAIGSDVDLRGGVRVGSVLLEEMTIAGE